MKALFTVMLALAAAGSVMAQPPDSLWSRTFGGSSYDDCRSVQQTSEGGYVLAGYTYSFGAGVCDFYLVKTDANGNQLWSRTFGGTNYEKCMSVRQTSDAGYVLAGLTESFGAGSDDFWLVKTDANGNQLWSRTFGGTNVDGCYSVQQTSDGGYVLAGYTQSFGAGSTDFWLVKTDGNGNQQWSRTFGGTSDDVCRSVRQTSDGGYVLGGYTSSFGAGGWDFWLVKTDANGNSLWSRTFDGSYYDECNSVQQTSDGGYVLGGYTSSFGAGNEDFWLVKTDGNGNYLWNLIFGGMNSDRCHSVQQTSDGGYVLAGSTLSFGAGNWDSWLVKTNPSGNVLWSRTFGGAYSDVCYSVQQTSDYGYVLAGGTNSFGAGSTDFWLVKTGPELWAEPGLPTVPTGYELYPNWPNPFNAITTFEFAVPRFARVDLRAYDVLGRDAGMITDGFFAAGRHQVQWHCPECASGIYFVIMSGEGFRRSQKAMLLR